MQQTKVTLYADRTRRHGQHCTRTVAHLSRTRLGSVSTLAIRKQPRMTHTGEVITVTALLEYTVQACTACLPLLLR